MPRLLSIVVSACVLATSLPAAALEPADVDQLYEEGKQEFALSNFGKAIEKWEAAFKQSGNPLLLYNLSQAYRGRFGTQRKLEDLRKAKLLAERLRAAIADDPSLGDAEEIDNLIADISSTLEQEEAKQQAEETGPVEPDEVDPTETEPVDEPPPPGQTLRRAGIGLIATGGVLTVTGVALGAVFGTRGKSERENLNTLYTMEEELGCLDGTAMGDDCFFVEQDIETARENGKRANLYMGVSLGVLGAVGIASLVTGVVLFKKGKRAAAESEETFARVRVVPSLGGLSLTGRF